VYQNMKEQIILVLSATRSTTETVGR